MLSLGGHKSACRGRRQGAYVNMTGVEMKAIAMAAVMVVGGARVVGCTASKLPVAVANRFAVACFMGGDATLATLVNTIASIANNGSYANTTCYQTLITSSQPFVATSASNCS